MALRISMVLVWLFSTVAVAQENPTEVTDTQVLVYKTGLDKGCRDAGRRKGDPQQKVNDFCDCLSKTLNESLRLLDWQQAYFFSVKRQEHEEMQVLGPHMRKVAACKPQS